MISSDFFAVGISTTRMRFVWKVPVRSQISSCCMTDYCRPGPTDLLSFTEGNSDVDVS